MTAGSSALNVKRTAINVEGAEVAAIGDVAADIQTAAVEVVGKCCRRQPGRRHLGGDVGSARLIDGDAGDAADGDVAGAVDGTTSDVDFASLEISAAGVVVVAGEIERAGRCL